MGLQTPTYDFKTTRFLPGINLTQRQLLPVYILRMAQSFELNIRFKQGIPNNVSVIGKVMNIGV